MSRQATLDQKTLEMALIGYEVERARIQTVIDELEARVGANAEGIQRAPKKRTLGAAARAKIAAAQRQALREAEKEPPRPKRKLSAARRAIAEATRRRWAAFHEMQAANARANARKRAAKAPTTAALAG